MQTSKGNLSIKNPMMIKQPKSSVASPSLILSPVSKKEL